jgi:PncC family amidohydrolase
MTTTAEEIAKILIDRKLTISTTESCTGGLLSSKLTDISGSSSFIHLNLVTYANETKHKMLGVRNETLENFGAVSEECAYEMASGLMKLTGADICVSTTGIAGPTGATKEKPVGLMYSTICTKDKAITFETRFHPEIPRIEMKEMFVQAVLEKLYKLLSENN